MLYTGSSFKKPDFPPEKRFRFVTLESCPTFSHFSVLSKQLNDLILIFFTYFGTLSLTFGLS